METEARKSGILISSVMLLSYVDVLTLLPVLHLLASELKKKKKKYLFSSLVDAKVNICNG